MSYLLQVGNGILQDVKISHPESDAVQVQEHVQLEFLQCYLLFHRPPCIVAVVLEDFEQVH